MLSDAYTILTSLVWYLLISCHHLDYDPYHPGCIFSNYSFKYWKWTKKKKKWIFIQISIYQTCLSAEKNRKRKDKTKIITQFNKPKKCGKFIHSFCGGSATLFSVFSKCREKKSLEKSQFYRITSNCKKKKFKRLIMVSKLFKYEKWV